MNEKRLPSFNDFSPSILKGDLRPCLKAVVDGAGNDASVTTAWATLYFEGKKNKRSTVNIPATLRSTGLSTGTKPITLSPFGQSVLAAPSAKEAAAIFCAHLLREKHGDLLLQAMRALHARHAAITKESLQAELKGLGITSLSTNTTDHTTLKNWLIFAGLVNEAGVPNEKAVKAILGVTVEEADDLLMLPLGQQVFLRLVRREHLLSSGPFSGQSLLHHCLEHYPDVFRPAEFAKQIRDPLAAAGWIDVAGLAKGPQGGKSGMITGSPKLLAIPVQRFVPDFDAAVPADLKAKLLTPPEKIRADLRGSDTHLGGLALELLALRMVFDLGLDPRHFRLRSAKSAHAEVDLLAEGAHLMFSRWTVQCKRYTSSKTKVQLGDVAKEVGIAVFSRAHVVVMVTTSDFTSSARKYAEEVSLSMPLQFLFIDGKVVDAYLKRGKDTLLEHARANAQRVMKLKRGQPLASEEDVSD
jgi:hypothetical protein